MAGNGVPGKGKFDGLTGVAGGSAKGVLLVLLALAVCFGYFYFFTDMLRPKEETPMQSEVYTTEVRKPLPERPSRPSAIDGEETAPVAPPAPSPAEAPAAAAPPLVTAPQSPPPPRPVKVESPPIAPAGAAGQAAKPKAAAAKVAVQALKPSTAGRKIEPVKVPSKETGKTSRDGKVGTSATKTEAAKSADRKSSEVKRTLAPQKVAAPKSGKSPAAEKGRVGDKVGENYTLVVGTYVLKSSMLAAKSKLEGAGLKPSVTAGRRKAEPMNRLLLSEFPSYSSAISELTRVKKAIKDAFILPENGKYALYAGSYFSHDRAMSEQERLRGLGFAPIVKKTEVPVQTYVLRAGSYATREAADKEAARLRGMGFKPVTSEMGK